MDEAVEIIITGTKLQNFQTILSIFISGINNYFFYIIPFLFNSPSLNHNYTIINNTKEKPTLQEFCGNNGSEIYEYLDNKISIENYSVIYQLFCEDNISKIQILIVLFYFSKGISSVFLGFLTDKFGRKIILYYCSILTIITSFCIFLSLYNYYFLLLTFILFGICSYLYIFSSILVCEFLDRNKAATISSLNISSGIIFAIIFISLLKIFNNLIILYLIMIIFSVVLFYYIKLYFNESLYYLISRNKINEFFELLENLAQLNERKNLYEKINQERYITDKIKSFSFIANILDVFNYNSQYHRLINHSLLWIFSSFSFYGIFQILSFFNPFDNFFVNYIIFFVLSSIGQILFGIISDFYGRRAPLSYSFYICSISYLIFILTEEKILIKKIFFFICIITSSSLFSLLFIFSSEDFPTSIRGTVLGFLFGISQIIALIIYYINNPLILCLVISLSNCIGGRITESMEDTFELLLDDTFPEMYKNDNLKKKKYRALKCERISTGSDLYFLTSDDEAFNQEIQSKYS